jgi:hypothetical protein
MLLYLEDRLDRKDVEEEIRKYDEKLSQNLIYSYDPYIVYEDTCHFNVYEYPFIAWKSEKEIDRDLVKHYTDLILSGARPFAVILKENMKKIIISTNIFWMVITSFVHTKT